MKNLVIVGTILTIMATTMATSHNRSYQLNVDACNHCHKLLAPEEEIAFRTCVFSFGSYVRVTRDYCLRLGIIPSSTDPSAIRHNTDHSTQIEYINQLLGMIKSAVDDKRGSMSVESKDEVNPGVNMNENEKIMLWVFLTLLIILLFIIVISNFKVAFCGRIRSPPLPTNTFQLTIPGLKNHTHNLESRV